MQISTCRVVDQALGTDEIYVTMHGRLKQIALSLDGAFSPASLKESVC